MKNMKKILGTSQFALFALFAATWIIFGFINSEIFSLASLFSLTRACIVPAIFSLALMIIMVQGGIDLSFAAVASSSSYVTVLIYTRNNMMDVPLIVIFLTAAVFAVSLELINWFFIDKMEIPPLITTLATQTLIKGGILAFISTSFIYTLPDSMRSFGTTNIATAAFPNGTESVLHVSVLFVAALYVIIHFTLEYTSFGRSIYAIGDDVTAARRAGIKVSKVRLYSFIIVGLICSIGGVIHNSLLRATVPWPPDIVGQELTNIAAVVLGCGMTKQARGSVIGTLLGVVFLRFVGTNLIMIGVPSYWQKAVSGLIIFTGLIIQMSNKRKVT
jgi:simple sugar transport system permease protein